MALFNQFPWTNFHELNLDWLLKKVAEMEQAFPEGTIGIPKGGTGATTAEEARANLGVYGINIPLSSLDSTTIDEAIQDVAGDLDELMEALNYKLYKSVTSLPGQIPGTATVSNCWNAMSQGEILLAPPDQFYPGECPETYGTLIMIRSGATSGYCLFAGGDHLYKKTFSGNTPLAGWQQVFTDSDIIPIANGGTGADNAADAVTNLGIDFSGEVLSVAGVGAKLAGLDINNSKIITCHLGAGSSICAIQNGKCVDTSMGFTPLEGMIMGTRVGNIDANAVLYLEKKLGVDPDEMTTILNRKSGFLGVSTKTSDARELDALANEGDPKAKLVFKKFTYDIIKNIGSYVAAMNGVDLIIFTGGIGEHNSRLRRRVLENFSYLGLKVDYEANVAFGEDAIITTEDSQVKAALICTNEELVIARDTMHLVLDNQE